MPVPCDFANPAEYTPQHGRSRPRFPHRTKEAHDHRNAGRRPGEKLVQEGRSAVQFQRLRRLAQKKSGLLRLAGSPPLGAVSSKARDVIRAGIEGAHLRKQRAVERVVVSVREERFVSRERSVRFERVVSRGQAAFGAEEGAQGARERPLSCGIAADGQSPCGDDVARQRFQGRRGIQPGRMPPMGKGVH